MTKVYLFKEKNKCLIGHTNNYIYDTIEGRVQIVFEDLNYEELESREERFSLLLENHNEYNSTTLNYLFEDCFLLGIKGSKDTDIYVFEFEEFNHFLGN